MSSLRQLLATRGLLHTPLGVIAACSVAIVHAFIPLFLHPAKRSNLEGEVNTPVSVGGVSVQPADLVVGDDDGVFILNPQLALELGQRARDLQREEQQKRSTLEPAITDSMKCR
ncbi:MAG: hypothetical protein IDH49_07170 [Gammaproteobacteria bacterium]|nr:hypothetical protein [Gammaproteobacteria bacterium]